MQINRLFGIIYILLDKKLVTAGELAEHFEVSVRTIYRDVEALSASGIPIYMSKGKGGGISLLPGFVLNKAVLTEKEKEELLSSIYALEAVQLDSESTTLQKLKELLGAADTSWISVDFGAWSEGEREAALFEQLKAAILGRRVIRFAYVSVREGRTKRETEPVQLVFKGVSWYLYAYCRTRKDYRYFKLKRIRELSVQEECFLEQQRDQTCPQAVHDQNENAQAQDFQKKKAAFQPNMVHIRLLIHGEAAYRVYDEFESFTEQPDGSLLVEADVPDGSWLMQYLLGYGSALEVIEPATLKARLRTELEKMLEKMTSAGDDKRCAENR